MSFCAALSAPAAKSTFVASREPKKEKFTNIQDTNNYTLLCLKNQVS